MERMQDLTALLKHEVEDLMSAEDQIIEAMPAMIEKATNAALTKSLKDHLRVTEKQRKRLDQVQKLLNNGEQPAEKKGFLSNLFGGSGKSECKGMKGLIEEGQKVMAEDMNTDVKDAAIIACAQKIEHYEICGYGTAKAYAKEINRPDIAKLLDETLTEEYQADDLLTRLAVGKVNEKADNNVSSSKSASNGTATKSSANGSATKSAAGKNGRTVKASKSAKSAGTVKRAASKGTAKKVATTTKSKPK
jgi:ferritin-like metal-binding protein YciE